MLLSLDNLAKRYGLLPSEALGRANTFDLHVLDVSTKFQQHLNEKNDGKTAKNKLPTQQDMLNMVKSVQGEDYDFN
jgi:hypothetical protein